MNPWIIAAVAALFLLTGSKKPDVKKKQEPGTKGPAPAPGVGIADNGGAGVIVDFGRQGIAAGREAISLWNDIRSTPPDSGPAEDGRDFDPGDDSMAPPATPIAEAPDYDVEF